MDFESIQFIALIAVWIMCPVLLGLILLQGGAGDISSAFGGGGQLDSTLGVGAVQKIGKITAWLIILLFVCVITVAIPNESAFTATVPAASGGEDSEVLKSSAPAGEEVTPIVNPAPAPVVVTPAPVVEVAPAPVAEPAPAEAAQPEAETPAPAE